MSIKLDTDRAKENLGFLLWHTNMIWQRELNRALGSVGLTHTQFAIMSAISSLLMNTKSVTQKAIAERSNTDTMMVSKVLRKLEEKGLIERREHPQDTRAKCVFLTKAGIENFQQAFRIVSESNAAFFGKLSDEALFRKELQKLIEHVNFI